jgi:hypothetical protein
VKKVKGKGGDKTPDDAASENELVAPLTWAQRLKRVFNIDIAVCPVCRGTLRIIAEITDPDVIQKILHHMRGPPRAQAPSLESATAPQS